MKAYQENYALSDCFALEGHKGTNEVSFAVLLTIGNRYMVTQTSVNVTPKSAMQSLSASNRLVSWIVLSSLENGTIANLRPRKNSRNGYMKEWTGHGQDLGYVQVNMYVMKGNMDQVTEGYVLGKSSFFFNLGMPLRAPNGYALEIDFGRIIPYQWILKEFEVRVNHIQFCGFVLCLAHLLVKDSYKNLWE